jgi:hypothetical protein
MSKRTHQPLGLDGILKGKQFESFERTIKQQQELQLAGQGILDKLKLSPCRIATLRQGVAVIEAPSSVWLSRLKQLKFALLSELRKTFPGLIALELTINPELAHVKAPLVQPQLLIKKRPVSLEAERHIKELKEKLAGLRAVNHKK